MRINFSGLGFEIGQKKLGLAQSPQLGREYLRFLTSLDFIDFGDSNELNTNPPQSGFVLSNPENIDWILKKYENIFYKTKQILTSGIDPLINWGGDHSIALATLGAFKTVYPNGKILWIDAHADLNHPSYSLSGNLHGMPLSFLLNLENIANHHTPWLLNGLISTKDIIYLGLRAVDPYETQIINDLGITHFTDQEISQRGILNVLNDIRPLIADSPLHVSFDIDSVEYETAPSTGIKIEHGGLTRNDLLAIAIEIHRQKNIKSMDIVEINPLIGTKSQVEKTILLSLQFLLISLTGGSYESSSKQAQRPDQISLA